MRWQITRVDTEEPLGRRSTTWVGRARMPRLDRYLRVGRLTSSLVWPSRARLCRCEVAVTQAPEDWAGPDRPEMTRKIVNCSRSTCRSGLLGTGELAQQHRAGEADGSRQGDSWATMLEGLREHGVGEHGKDPTGRQRKDRAGELGREA